MIEVPLPALVAVSDAINEPRYPSLKGIDGREEEAARDPRRWPISASMPAEAGDAGSKTEVLALGDAAGSGRRASRSKTTANAAQAILDFLAEKQLV